MTFAPLNALNAFMVVARRKSYAAAAKDLGVSTSALSQSVRQLESRLGVTLLTRTSRNVALTDAGLRLVENAGPALDQVLESLRTAGARRDEVTGRVKLTVPSVAVPLVLAPLLPRFNEKYPKVEVDVRVEDNFVNIVAEGLDAGIRLIEAVERDMVHVRLSPPSRLVVAAAPSYLERRGIPQKPADLLHHDCIGMRFSPHGEVWVWEFEKGKKLWRIPVQGSVISNSFELRQRLALAGMGLVYGMDLMIAQEVARGQLRLVLEQYAPTVPGLFLYFPNRAQVSPALKAFVEVAREVVAESGAKRAKA